MKTSYIYIYIYKCWLSLSDFVVWSQSKCDIIWRVLNICDRAIL